MMGGGHALRRPGELQGVKTDGIGWKERKTERKRLGTLKILADDIGRDDAAGAVGCSFVRPTSRDSSGTPSPDRLT